MSISMNVYFNFQNGNDFNTINEKAIHGKMIHSNTETTVIENNMTERISTLSEDLTEQSHTALPVHEIKSNHYFFKAFSFF